jgi:hypothetical protein
MKQERTLSGSVADAERATLASYRTPTERQSQRGSLGA